MQRSPFQVAILPVILAILTGMASFMPVLSEPVKPQPSPTVSLDAVKADLELLDATISRKKGDPAGAPAYQIEGVIQKTDIKARDIYRNYLREAGTITDELFKVQKEIDKHRGSISMQQLSALSQEVSTLNKTFQSKCTHGEEKFQTYLLIQKAVVSLDEAMIHWRLSRKYRPIYRGTNTALKEDEDILRVKLQVAQQAIEDLQDIKNAREALNERLITD